jgi:hypothetical protein
MKTKLCLIVLALLLHCIVAAQEFRATLTGTVTDASGAAVPNATITARNVETNEESKTTTSSQGTYTIPLLRPGSYAVTAEAPGFKRYVREAIQLQLGQSAGVNIALEVGAITESVSVTAEAPLLDTSKADRGGVIDTERIHELPINGRNPFLLGAMVAGVNFHGAAIWQRPFDNGAIADWTINGGQARGTEFLLDGAPNNAQMGGNNIAYVPPVDSVAEFKIQTNSYDAQYGHTNGGIVNVSTKSGTNDLHGSVYGFWKRADWAANLFQNNAYGRERPPTTLNIYGFQVGGPVYVPKVFDGRNKLFFMMNYEDYFEEWPQPLQRSIPTPEMLQGDFSRMTNAQGQLIRIYDPLTANAGNNYARTPFPGNIIPASRVSPIAQNVLNYFPDPNASSPGRAYSENNFFNGANAAVDNFYNLLFKFDVNFGDRHRMFFRHASNDRTEMRNENTVIGPGECCQLPFQRINDHVTLDWVSTLSSTLILNIRGSYNRFIEKGTSAASEGFDPVAELGLPQSLMSQVPVSGKFPKFEFRGQFDYPDLGRYPSGNTTNTYAVHPNLNWIVGAHSLKFGVDYRFTQYSAQDVGNVIRLRSTRRWTRERWDQDDALSGNPIADFLLGLPSEGEINYRQLPIYGNDYTAPYFQDDWRVSRRLTLNMGLRWDFNTPPRERYTRGNYIFDPNAVPDWAGQVNTANLAINQVRGGLTFLGVDGNPTTPAKMDWNNIQPRIGGAYQVTDKVVARAGWGVYYINPNNDWASDTVRQGFDVTTPLVRSLDDDRTPIQNVLANPFPTVLTPPGASGGLNTFLNRDITYFDPNFHTPYVHQFSAGLQFELPYNSVVEVSYVGSRTRDLQTEWDGLNEPSADFRRLCNPFEGGDPNFCNQNIPNPFRGIEAFRGTNLFTAANMSRWDAAKPFPQFGRIRTRGSNEGAIWFNSLQMQHQTRFRGGVNILSTFTWSKQIERWSFTDQINRIPQQSAYVWDRPWRVTFAGVWQLPFGRGRRFGSGVNGFVNRLINGWEITGFFQWDAGRPWDLPGEGTTGTGGLMLLDDPKVEIDDWIQHRVQGASPCVAQYRNATRSFELQPYAVAAGCTQAVWLHAPQYTGGRYLPRRSSQVRLHSAPNLDASINKTTTITERVRLQFRAEAFNVTNTFYWGRTHFINDPNNSNFGAYFPRDATDQNRYPRQLQLALKLLF